jgi:hypothetical protein
MANLSNYAESGLLNFLFRTNTNNFTKPATVAVALCSGIPAESCNGITIPELPNAAGYARVNLGAPANAIFTEVVQTFGDLTDSNGSGNISNAGAVVFPVATANWGMVSGVAIVDSGVFGTGQMLIYGALQTPRDVKSGDTFQFNIGDLNLYLG